MGKTRSRLYLFLAFCCSVLTLGSVAGQTPLPTARQIVDRYDKALGGRDAVLRHNSSTMRGTIEVHEGDNVAKFSFVYFASAPYRRLEKVSLPNGAGEMLNGFDGETAWSMDPRNGAKVYVGDERESMKRDADFYYALNELSWFKSMDTVGIEDFEGRACYRLHGTNNWNKTNDHFYDRETGVLAGYEFNSEFGPTHEVFSDYQRVDGVLVPTKQFVKAKSSGGSWDLRQVLNFESVTFNDVDPGVFTPPQAVRDLLEKGKAAAPRGN
jgi:hypothetical protein